MHSSEIHAIGDEAAEAVLEAFEKASLRPDDRPILTHCQILGPDLIDKMARQGVIANVQPQVRLHIVIAYFLTHLFLFPVVCDNR